MQPAVGKTIKRIGLLALQGAFIEHEAMLKHLGMAVVQVRLPQHLDDLDGLIIPGGESTTIGKLMVDYDLLEPLRRFGQQKAIWGTCAGAIFLSKITRDQPHLLGLMGITVERNAFGRQADSFEADLLVSILENPDKPFPSIFIRAPLIASVGPDVEILAHLPDGDNNGIIVAAKEGHFLATSFHPELSGDDRFHRYFLHMVKNARSC